MIRFLGTNDDGTERVAVVDYSREEQGEIEFTFRAQLPDEPLFWYLDRIMNSYWFGIGKNVRRWQDE